MGVNKTSKNMSIFGHIIMITTNMHWSLDTQLSVLLIKGVLIIRKFQVFFVLIIYIS